MESEIRDIEELDKRLSEPTAAVREVVAGLEGDFLLLGAGGKMGPSLAWMLRRSVEATGGKRRVIAVSRFTVPGQREWLEARGVETVACDLLDEEGLARLPEAGNVMYLAGLKFGATGREPSLWAMNTHLPGMVARRFRRSRMVIFSTGNVYGLKAAGAGGSSESDPVEPAGEYAMSCLGRERIFEYFGQRHEIPMVLIRLNYASELRYGVLVDLARRVWGGEPVDCSTGQFNTIWQGDANAFAIQAFGRVAVPAAVVNVTGDGELGVREICGRFAELMRREAKFVGTESGTALLSDARLCREWFGEPRVSVDQMIRWVADWVMRDGPTLDKPTMFEKRDGRF
ncbi:MAG TPA: NAD(P)-dependent oxidoreductase [Methylomirabilota bacterium]|nr:NAD(P)-dependent oxidoreductase [Methylomirabilota bacterium]